MADGQTKLSEPLKRSFSSLAPTSLANSLGTPGWWNPSTKKRLLQELPKPLSARVDSIRTLLAQFPCLRDRRVLALYHWPNRRPRASPSLKRTKVHRNDLNGFNHNHRSALLPLRLVSSRLTISTAKRTSWNRPVVASARLNRHSQSVWARRAASRPRLRPPGHSGPRPSVLAFFPPQLANMKSSNRSLISQYLKRVAKTLPTSKKPWAGRPSRPTSTSTVS